MSYVVDCSMLIAWLFEDERTDQTEALLKHVKPGELWAPVLLKYELLSVARKSVIAGRIGQAEVANFMHTVDGMAINYTDLEYSALLSDVATCEIVVSLSLKFGLSTYDACYLQVALAKRLPLATLDKKLGKAALDAGVKVLP